MVRRTARLGPALWLCLLHCTAGPWPCARDADCPQGVCAVALGEVGDLEPLPLGCGAAGGGAAPGTACATPADCDRGLCLVGGGCAAACVDASDCHGHAACRDAVALGDERTHPVRVCVQRIVVAEGVQVSVTEQTLEFSEPVQRLALPGTDRPTLYVVALDADQGWPFSTPCRPPLCPTALETLESPPASLYPLSAPDERATPIAAWPYAFPLSVYVGNSVRPHYVSEGYGLWLTGMAGTVRITRLSRTEAPDPRLNLNLFYAGAAGLAPMGSTGPPAIAAALEEVARILAQADIALGEVRQRRIPGALLDRGNTFDGADPRTGFATLKPGYGVWPELPALLALSAGAPNTAVNLFLVADIPGMGPDEIQALTGGIPGPMGLHGTGASGIAIATDMLLEKPARLGRTIAHEVGHYLGLFHVIEPDGSTLDPLADTPICAPDRDANRDGRLTPAECAGAGADNLMFWAETGGTELTPDQATILRRALVL